MISGEAALPRIGPTVPDLLALLAPPATPDRAPVERNRAPSRDENNDFAKRLGQDNSERNQSGSQAASTRTSPAARDEQARQADAPNQAADAAPDAAPAHQEISDDGPVTDLATATSLLETLQGAVEPPSADLVLLGASGEPISMTPPALPQAGAGDPGALARWFMQASGPAASNTGLLNTLKGQTSLAAVPAMPATSASPDSGALNGPLGTPPGAQATPSAELGDSAPSFADALAASNADPEGLDAFLSHATKTAAAGIDTAANTGNAAITATATTATGAQAAMTIIPQATTGQAVPVAALAVEISRQAGNGKTQFDIRLDPPELGRLNVRLEVDASGKTRTHMTVERSETLDMLLTDARSLERALQQAGLKSEPGSVTFELAADAGGQFAQDQAGKDASGQSGDHPGHAALDDGVLAPFEAGDAILSTEAVRQRYIATGHLDVRV